MWSQPNIVRMNAEAEKQKPDLQAAVRLGFIPTFRQTINKSGIKAWLKQHSEWKGKPHAYKDGVLILGDELLTCRCAGWSSGEECSEDLEHYLWYDIFSDDPKGVLTLCMHHDGYSGSPCEGFFKCADCNRVFAENYTWEKYYTILDYEQVCLPCAAKRYITDESNWIHLTKKDIAKINFERIRSAQHVIGVDMPVPNGIKFFDNAEFDSMDGHQISGVSIQSILLKAKAEGYKDALLILDAAYQFAVSIGVYVKAEESKQQVA